VGGGVLAAVLVLLATGCAGADPGGAGPGQPERLRVMMAQAPAPDGRTLQVSVDRCHHGPYAMAVAETATRVSLRVSGGTPETGTAEPDCADVVTVHLARALGSRGVFDVTSGSPVAVRTIRRPTPSSR